MQGLDYVAGVAIIDEATMDGRGWFYGAPGLALRNDGGLRTMIRLWETIARVGPWHELRAWVHSDDPVAIAFAERLGFAYDAGPCVGFSPAGLDVTLYRWRRDNEPVWRGRHGGSRGSATARLRPKADPRGE